MQSAAERGNSRLRSGPSGEVVRCSDRGLAPGIRRDLFNLDQTPDVDPAEPEPVPGPRFVRCPVFDQSLPEDFED